MIAASECEWRSACLQILGATDRAMELLEVAESTRLSALYTFGWDVAEHSSPQAPASPPHSLGYKHPGTWLEESEMARMEQKLYAHQSGLCKPCAYFHLKEDSKMKQVLFDVIQKCTKYMIHDF